MNDKTFPDMNTIDQLLRHSGLPRLEARMLLEAITGYNHAALLMRGDECLSEKQGFRQAFYSESSWLFSS